MTTSTDSSRLSGGLSRIRPSATPDGSLCEYTYSCWFLHSGMHMQLIDAQIHAVLPVAELDAGLTHDQAVAVSAELAVASMDAVGVTAAVVSDQLAQVRGYLANHP